MSLASRLAVPLFVLTPLIAATPARAEATPEAAASLQAQIQAWMADLVGPTVDLGSHVARVSPEGEGYRFELPVMGPLGPTGWLMTGDPVTATAKPLDGGRWTIESLRLPTPLRAEQQPIQEGKPRNWVLNLTDQQFDPSLATGSSFEAVLRGYDSVARTAAGVQITHLDRYAWHGGWQPTGEGRVSVSSDGQGENLTMSIGGAAEVGPVTVNAAAMHSGTRIERIGFAQLGAAMRSISGLLPAATQAAGAAGVPAAIAPKDREGLRALVIALRDLLGGVRHEMTLERLRIDVAGQGGTVDSLTVGGSAAAPDGMLEASLHLAAVGFDSPLIPQGPLRDYLPRRIALSPRVSGLPMKDVMALLLRAIDEDDKDALQGEAVALLAKGPLEVGLDDVVVDLGSAVLKAGGTMTIAAPDDIEGNAGISVTGLDTLIRRANTVPELRSAAPFLIFLKGIGEQKGDAVIWNITYADGKTDVNGTDLSTLLPSGADKKERPRGRK